jgi:hypothetical protein
MLMSTSIFAFLTVGDWWGKFIEICMPAWIQRYQLYRMKSAVVSLKRIIWKMRSDKGLDGQKAELLSRRHKYLLDSQQQCWTEALKKDYTVSDTHPKISHYCGYHCLIGSFDFRHLATIPGL